MSGRIKVTPEQMRSAASQFKSSSQQSNDMVNRLTQQMSGMQPEWEGMSSQKFFQDFQQWKGSMTQFVTLLNEIGVQLEAIATRFEQADRPG
ncbi:MAG: WXG100 family type VII secretion target [Chloroflexales bacterium]